MKIRALTSFSGMLCMAKGEVIECDDKSALDDLLSAGYIECVEEKKAPKRSVKKGEDQ